MKNITLFGCKLWSGVSAKVAKRYFSTQELSIFDLFKEMNKQDVNGKNFAESGVGDLINTCNGFNAEIATIIPYYRNLGKGRILNTIEIFATNGYSCLIDTCGVSVPRTREQIESKYYTHYKYFVDSRESEEQKTFAKTKYGDKLDLLEAGKHISDERGILYQPYMHQTSYLK